MRWTAEAIANMRDGVRRGYSMPRGLVAATLPNAKHFVAPQIGHGVSLHGCGPRLVESFVRAGSAARLDGKCLERIPRPLFLLPLGAQSK